MSKPPPPVSRKFVFLAGTPSLDFGNTAPGGRAAGAASDRGAPRFQDYNDLLAWATEAKLVTRPRARDLAAAAEQNPPRAADIFARSLRLREAIHAVFSSLASGKSPPQSELALLNDELVEAMRNARIVSRPSRKFDWQLPPEVCGLYYPLQAVARDAAELLTSRHLQEVRECANRSCGHLFLDETRNHSRLWCDMRACGNRVKQARYRSRSAATAKPQKRRG